MTGSERRLLYQVAVETGMRANELRTLKVSSFDFKTNTVQVVAAYSKHRKEDTLPLRPQTAEALRSFFAGKTPQAKAFGGRYKHLTDKTSKVIEADLADAGISYTDDAGRFRDFHAYGIRREAGLRRTAFTPRLPKSSCGTQTSI